MCKLVATDRTAGEQLRPRLRVDCTPDVVYIAHILDPVTIAEIELNSLLVVTTTNAEKGTKYFAHTNTKTRRTRLVYYAESFHLFGRSLTRLQLHMLIELKRLGRILVRRSDGQNVCERVAVIVVLFIGLTVVRL